MKKNLGNILRHLRKEQNATQQDVADFLYVSRQTYVRYELDIVELTLSQVYQVSAYYKIDITTLLKMIENEQFTHSMQRYRNN